MFDHTSRYYHIETAIFEWPDGRKSSYKRRRFLPQPESLTILGEAIVQAEDRLDLIAARALGDPLVFWRICDANGAMRTDDLLEIGRRLNVPLPQPGA
jgi:hypothetical protein